MADETTAATEIETAEKVETAAAEAPAEVKAEAAEKAPEPEAKPIEAKPETKAPKAKATKTKAPKAKRTVRKAAASKRAKKAAPAPEPVKAAKKKPVRKPAAKKPSRKPAAKKIAKSVNIAKPARAGTRKIEGVKIMTTKKNSIDAGLFAAEQMKTVFGDVNERAKAAAERSAKIVEELADLTRGNVEAIVASSKVAAKGIEALSQDAAEYGRKSFEDASAAIKSLTEVKSATDLFKLQGDFARAAFDSAVAESARLSETMLKIAGDVAEPITSRYTVAAERVKTLAA